MKKLIYIFLLVFFCNFSFKSFSQQIKNSETFDSLVKKWDRAIPESFSGRGAVVFDSAQIVIFLEGYPAIKRYNDQIRNFYRNRDYSFAWFENGKLIKQANELSDRVINLQKEGVYKQIPYQHTLYSLLHESDSVFIKKQPDIMLELMLTAQYFVFSKLAWRGMDASVSKSAKWNLPRKKIAFDQYLDSLIKASDMPPSSSEPVYRQYELLRKFLIKYQALNAANKWPPISIEVKSLKPGDSSLLISLIKKRLFKLEDFKGDTLNYLYNDELLAAVKQFQYRHGLKADGLLGRGTLSELNVPLEKRIRQILVNMERSRWLPLTLDRDYLAVNIPEFKLHVYHEDSLLWSCNVVVGKALRQTAVFYGDIKYIVFSPYWNVPDGIIKHEVIPGMRKHSDYIATHDMEITGYRNGFPIVRQKPGPSNALGLVKFLFPNSYDIYLHDTPSKSLFGESTRAFSHGCIRISEPAKLANFLLKDNKEWNAVKIDTAMHSGKEQYVTLKNTVPVFIAYLTAFIDRSNKLNFRKDIYNLDDRLASMIISGNGEY